ncbi:MAG: hypothetical protein H8K05_18320, partial [Nitrospira sp.]|nr:hypothetical protein [Nitrospira sp.]
MSFTALGSRLKCVDGTLSSLGNPKRIKIEMDADYCADVDRVEEEDWYALLRLFHDTNIYQTWAYGVARNGRENISHIVVRKRGVVVGLAQSRIVQLPIIGAGIAYVMWGPLWRSRDAPTDTVALRQIIRALYNEYACKRGLLVRLYPPLFEEDHGWVIPLLKEEGFERSRLKASPRTIIMDLTPTIEDLHKSIGSQKRRELRIAEKQLEVIEGTDDALFGQFIDIYKEMVQRKKFVEPNDINQFREIQRQLPPEYKMKLM